MKNDRNLTFQIFRGKKIMFFRNIFVYLARILLDNHVQKIAFNSAEKMVLKPLVANFVMRNEPEINQINDNLAIKNLLK